MSPKSKQWNEEFLRKEFELVRHEMDESVKESRSLERYALTLTGGIWAWLAVNSQEHPVHPYAVWLPLLLVFLFFLRAVALYLHTNDIADHLKDTEKLAFNVPFHLGWEQKFKEKGKFKRATFWLFWILLLAATIVVPLYFW